MLRDLFRLICPPVILALILVPCADAQVAPGHAPELERTRPPAAPPGQSGEAARDPVTDLFERAVSGRTPEAVIARAKGVLPSARTIDIVARTAEPTRLTRAAQPGADALSAEQVITQLCGSVRPEYVTALKNENGIDAIDLSARLGNRAYSLAFPACLYADVNTARRKNYTVLAEDTPSDILRLFTGSWTVDGRLTQFMTLSFGRKVSARSLPQGERIAVPYITRPTVLFARDGGASDFASSLGKALGTDVAVDPPEIGGEIIASPKLVAGGTTAAAGEFEDCVNDDIPTYPFSAKAVAAAYGLSRDVLLNEVGASQQTVRLVIVDNGFFGVPCPDAARCPLIVGGRLQFADRFPERNFDADKFPFGALGPVISNRIKAINYYNGFSSADEVSGHGTHVAGLALGGPRFMDERSLLDLQRTSWLKLVIANLAAGQKTFPVGVDEQILLAIGKIDGPKIVNLSLTVDGDVRQGIAAVMRRAISNEQATGLFIAAAGNKGANLSGRAIYPAAFGGSDSTLPNVITIASIDSNGRLSQFSNWGGKAADMAAPGCKIASWIDASLPARPESGTSQAAPLVAFTAAMLRSIWDRSPALLKSRILYSGKMIADPAHRARVAAGVQLDMATAVLVRHDVVTYEVPPPTAGAEPTRVTLVGKVSVPLGGYSCTDGAGLPAAAFKIRSFKREGSDSILYWRLDDDSRNATCPAALQPAFGDTPNELVFAPTHRLDPDGLKPLTAIQHIPVGQLRSIVYAEPGPLKD